MQANAMPLSRERRFHAFESPRWPRGRSSAAAAVGLTVRLQPRRLMITPAAVGCTHRVRPRVSSLRTLPILNSFSTMPVRGKQNEQDNTTNQ